MPNLRNGSKGGFEPGLSRLRVRHSTTELLRSTMNDVMNRGMPSSWRYSEISPIYNGKGSVSECGNYRGIKLMYHTMKLWERIIENRIREIVELGNIGFRKGMSTTEPIFALRILQEKYQERKKDLHMVFVDLEKAYDRVPRDLIWWALRKKNIPEAYITIIQDMYKATKTRVKSRCGLTQYFDIEVVLHQGSILNPLLFIIIMDMLANTIQRDPPWAMLFADDLVICEETGLDVEQQLDSWREVLEGNVLIISRKKTEYLRPAGSSEEVCLAGVPIPCTSSFKYLGSTIDATGGCGADVDNRIRSAWNSWRGLSGVICDKKFPVKLKNKLYKTVIRPTLIYGSECWALHRAEHQRMHTTEMKMLRWIQGKTRTDRIRNEKFRSDAMVKPITTYVTQKRLSWYDHVLRRDDTNVAKHVTTMTVGGQRPRGRPKLRWMNRVQSDLRQNQPDRVGSVSNRQRYDIGTKLTFRWLIIFFRMMWCMGRHFVCEGFQRAII